MGGLSGENYSAGNGGGVSGTLIGGDYPILTTRQLPTKPSGPGMYDIIQAFKGAVKNAYELGVPPPQAPTAEDVMRWKVQNSPWVEEETLQKTNPQQFFKNRGMAVDT